MQLYTVESTIYGTTDPVDGRCWTAEHQLTSLDSLLSWLLVIGETLSLYIDAVSIPPQAHSPSALLLLDLNNGQVEMKIERSCAG
jgi:hypothetical protein